MKTLRIGRFGVNFGKSTTNQHGTQGKGEPWNHQMVCGWKVACLDLLQPIKQREKDNPGGGKTRAKWYKRFILYFPSGAWWNLDLVIVRPLAKEGEHA